MITSLIVKIKHTCPWLWRGVEAINSALMRIRYPRLPAIAAAEIDSVTHPYLRWSMVTTADVAALSSFLQSISTGRVAMFNPHPFDADTLSRMVRSRSFVMMKVCHGSRIVGYHFLRCFFIGKTFHGLIVGDGMEGRGIGSRMWAIGAAISARANIPMFATISSTNLSSLASCRRGCRAETVSALADGYLLLRCHPLDQ